MSALVLVGTGMGESYLLVMFTGFNGSYGLEWGREHDASIKNKKAKTLIILFPVFFYMYICRKTNLCKLLVSYHQAHKI